MGVPAAAMGATYPNRRGVARGIESARRPQPQLDRHSGRRPLRCEYGGCRHRRDGAGFWLIPALGIRATTWVGMSR